MSQTTFEDRVRAVQARGDRIAASKPKVDVLPDWRANVRGPVQAVAGVALGAAVLIALRLIAARVVVDMAAFQTIEAAEIVAAALIGVGALAGFGIRDRLALAAPLLGAALAGGLMHNAVHASPAMFDVLAGRGWTQATLAATTPDSLCFAGNTVFDWAPAEEVEEILPEAPAKPKVGFGRTEAEGSGGYNALGIGGGEATSDEAPVLPKVRRMN